MRAPLPVLHAVTDDRVVALGRVAGIAAELARVAGPRLAVHLRSRKLDGRSFHALARELGAALAPHGSLLAINGRADVARIVNAPLLVAGRGGLTVADARRVAREALIGRSVHDSAELRAAVTEKADFVVAGAVYQTTSHPGTPAGLALVREAAATGLPVIAIGGITPELATEVVGAGATAVAAVSALWDASDPAAAASAFLAALLPPGPGEVAVTINGEARRARGGITLDQLLADLGLDPRAVVVEHNRRIVRRAQLSAASVGEGDSIEVVHFVGGG